MTREEVEFVSKKASIDHILLSGFSVNGVDGGRNAGEAVRTAQSAVISQKWNEIWTVFQSLVMGVWQEVAVDFLKGRAVAGRACQQDCTGGLQPSSIPLDTPRRTPMSLAKLTRTLRRISDYHRQSIINESKMTIYCIL
jgi:hypothetical protein